MGEKTYKIAERLYTASKKEVIETETDEKTERIAVTSLKDGEGNSPQKWREIRDEIIRWKKTKKVVIFCDAGISRSNAMALSVLVKEGMPFEEAHSLIRKKVPIAQIDTGLLDLVKSL